MTPRSFCQTSTSSLRRWARIQWARPVESSRHAVRLAVAACALVGTVLVGVSPASAQTAGDGKISIQVDQSCTAPSGQASNACTISGTVSGPSGQSIIWQVDLFANDRWRIQFQAFTETASQECQYPMRVKGSYARPGEPATSFVLHEGKALDLNPQLVTTLILTVEQVRIDPVHSVCSG